MKTKIDYENFSRSFFIFVFGLVFIAISAINTGCGQAPGSATSASDSQQCFGLTGNYNTGPFYASINPDGAYYQCRFNMVQRCGDSYHLASYDSTTGDVQLVGTSSNIGQPDCPSVDNPTCHIDTTGGNLTVNCGNGDFTYDAI